MNQLWTEKDKRFDSIEEELEFLGSSSETANQVRLTTCAAVHPMQGYIENEQYSQ